jgi:hypothetical protein
MHLSFTLKVLEQQQHHSAGCTALLFTQAPRASIQPIDPLCCGYGQQSLFRRIKLSTLTVTTCVCCLSLVVLLCQKPHET